MVIEEIKDLFKQVLDIARPSTNPDDFVELERILGSLQDHLEKR